MGQYKTLPLTWEIFSVSIGDLEFKLQFILMEFCKTRGKWQTGRKEGGGADLTKPGARRRDQIYR